MLQKKYIDIHKIFKDKNPGAYKWTPNFLINYVKKIVHEDQINALQNRATNLTGFAYCAEAMKEVGMHIHCKGIENIPQQGGFILASNHPLGGIDGMALLQTVGTVRQDIRFLVNDLLKSLENFGELFVPVNKLGSTSLQNLRRIEEEYKSERGVLIFPAGLVSRRQKGVIKDLDWNKSFVTKAVHYNKPIVPVHLSGQLSNWFYNLSAARKMIGIKANLEMLYLADEMFAQKGKDFFITIGQPIEASVFTKDKKTNEWANLVRDFVYELSTNPNAMFANFIRS